MGGLKQYLNKKEFAYYTKLINVEYKHCVESKDFKNLKKGDILKKGDSFWVVLGFFNRYHYGTVVYVAQLNYYIPHAGKNTIFPNYTLITSKHITNYEKIQF